MKTLLLGLLLVFTLSGCETDAQVASRNLSKSAEMFEIERRIVFINGITGEYILSLEGRCSIEQKQRQLSVTCRTGKNEFKKHFLGLSDNTTFFVEQLGVADVSVYRYRVIFKPTTIIPNIDVPIG